MKEKEKGWEEEREEEGRRGGGGECLEKRKPLVKCIIDWRLRKCLEGRKIIPFFKSLCKA